MGIYNLPRELLRMLRPRVPEMLAALERLVRAESPSTEKLAADGCARVMAKEWLRRAAQVDFIGQKQRGDHIRAVWPPGRGGSNGQLLVLGHYDTVYATGTLRSMPFRVRGGRVYGPGTFDMKGGIVQALFALDALKLLRVPLRKRIVWLWTSDEEIGSESSRKLVEAEARRSDAVFVLEPALGARGLLKTSRKSIGEAELIAHGRAAHAGLAPEAGVNAVHELARQIVRIEKWNDACRGITVNADIIEGGMRSNVIAERARAVLDLRAMRASDMRRIEARLHSLRPVARGAKLEVRGGFSRPPLERRMSAELFERAQRIGLQMGMPLGECCAGGGSDGNFTAALGIPTLDGLGAVGDGAHSAGEYVVLRSMPIRAALLAALLAAS